MPFPPYICFHSLHVLPTSSVSVINNHVPISLPVYPFSNMLLVFTVRVLSLFSEFARISIVVLLSAVVHDKDVKLPPCFFVHHCCRGVFFPLKYISLEESFSPSVYLSVASRAAKDREERQIHITIAVVLVFFFFLPSRLFFCSLS